MNAIYNEIEPYAADWLVNLEAAGHIAPGRIDRRSIRDLVAQDVKEATQFHAFAGIAAWSYALRKAGWPDDRPVWTGSCPCQPFSSAGLRKGFADTKHLWPEWFRLIRECRPPVVFGEQVASPAGLNWLDTVSTDLEGEGYSVGAADLCAAGVGAPHLRQRAYFVAHANEARRVFVGRSGVSSNSDTPRGGDVDGCGSSNDGANALSSRLPIRELEELQRSWRREEGRAAKQRGRSPWADTEWLECRDGRKWPVEPGTFPLAHGAAARVGRLRAYGNAIVTEVAVTFIRAAMEALPDLV